MGNEINQFAYSLGLIHNSLKVVLENKAAIAWFQVNGKNHSDMLKFEQMCHEFADLFYMTDLTEKKDKQLEGAKWETKEYR